MRWRDTRCHLRPAVRRQRRPCTKASAGCAPRGQGISVTVFLGALTVLAEPNLLREAFQAPQSGSPARAGRRLCRVHAAKCQARCGAECSPQLYGVTVCPVRLSTSKAPSFHWGPWHDSTAIWMMSKAAASTSKFATQVKWVVMATLRLLKEI